MAIEPGNRTRTGRARGMPKWVKIFAWVGIAFVVLVVVMIASGHGPWQHMGVH